MGDSITVPDVCGKCGKLVRIDPHGTGDYPNRPVHSATGKIEC